MNSACGMTLDEPRDVQVRGVCLPPHPVHVEQGALPGGPPPLHAGNKNKWEKNKEKSLIKLRNQLTSAVWQL